MKSFLDLASTRRSIRKFEEIDVPESDIEYFIHAAVSAPSGCNSQCWKFIAIKDRNIIKQIELTVIKKIESILEIKGDELSQDYISSKRKMVSFFANAPVVIAVFMTKADFYDSIFISALKGHGYDDEGIMNIFANYDILSIGAAIQNMLLAIHEKGYGACWMNEPAIAGKEINEILGVPLEQKFISIIPVGVPAYTPKNKRMKKIDEVFRIL
ncbi:MAG: nitroreductase family protein [Anaerolineales bacterium]|nr:nitroreductase family protein [Anaerolineales bacterium]